MYAVVDLVYTWLYDALRPYWCKITWNPLIGLLVADKCELIKNNHQFFYFTC